ncbi:hypothetical protein L1987_62849 [Smallanthus sonchifolius]|uniref:Uncharacterized protein n=1 Tax=Smallanthus sonchifolius TaxID=185202 RepID=A0ACB9CBT3_9ASTR|nr:hypothetical protein L1987_62849 [Smallanthus sonchifolius]
MSLNATGQCSIATPSALFDGSKATTLCLFELLPKSPIEQFIQMMRALVTTNKWNNIDDDSNWILNQVGTHMVPFIAMYRKERQSLFIDPKPQDDKDNQKKSDPKPTLRWHKGENDDQDTVFNGNQINEENYLDADGNDDNIRSEGL